MHPPPAAFLIDLDGTLISGGRLLAGAAELIAFTAGRFVIVSNDAEHTPHQLARNLRRLGLGVSPDRIVLAGAATLDLLADEAPGARILLMGSMALRSYAERIGLVPVDDRPDVVVLARDRRFSYGRLAVAANAVRAGASLVVTNPDLTHPGPSGSVVPETGALLQALLACTGPVACRVIGKPEPELFRRALRRLGTEKAIVIGDNPATDGAGAERLGLGFVHVGDGQPPAVTSLLGLGLQPPGEYRRAAR